MYIHKNPLCDKCGHRMNRIYYYKKKHLSGKGNWYKFGWGCTKCQIVRYEIEVPKEEGQPK